MKSGGAKAPGLSLPRAWQRQVARPRTLVIGYGNTLRGDDGVGPVVVALLQGYGRRRGKVRFLSAFQLLPEFAVDIAAAQRVIFIDASVALPPGRTKIAHVKKRGGQQLLGHAMSPQNLLALASAIGDGQTPEAWTVAIGVASMGVGEGLSAKVKQAAQLLAKKLATTLLFPARTSKIKHLDKEVCLLGTRSAAAGRRKINPTGQRRTPPARKHHTSVAGSHGRREG